MAKGGLPPKVQDAITMGRTLRQAIKAHIEKHTKDYQPRFAVSSKWTETTEGGKIPKTWSEWLESLLRDKRWICAETLQAAAIRLGINITVLQEDLGESQPTAHFQCNLSNAKTVVLFLQEDHFQAVVPEHLRPWPKQWMGEVGGPEALRRGGGKSVSSKTSAGTDKRSLQWLPKSTPKTHKTHTKQSAAPSWIPSSTPSKASKEIKKKSQKSWLPAKTPSRTDHNKNKRRAHDKNIHRLNTTKAQTTAFSNVQSEQPDISLHEDLQSDGFRPDRAPYPRLPREHPQNKHTHDNRPQQEQAWTCPLCQTTITVPAGPRARYLIRKRKSNHQQSRHYGMLKGPNNIGRISDNTTIVVPSNIPIEQRKWTCYICKLGLPEIPSKHGFLTSITQHFKKAHPDVSATQAYRQKQREDPEIRARMSKRGQHVGQCKQQKAIAKLPELQKQTKHELLYLQLKRDPSKTKRNTATQIQLCCRKCWKRSSPTDLLQQDCNWSSCGSTALKKWARSLCKEHPENKDTIQKAFRGFNLDDEADTHKNKGPKNKQTKKTTKQVKSKNKKQHKQQQALWRHGGHRAERIGEASHPGPSTQPSIPCHFKERRTFRFATLNTGGAPGVWRAIETMLQPPPDVQEAPLDILCLQEASLQQNEALAVQRFVARLGYIAYYTPGSTSTNGWGQAVPEGGLLSIVQRNIHSTVITEHGNDVFQHQFIQAGQWTIINSYSPPREGCGTQALAVWHELMLQAFDNHQARPWIWVGDTNMNTKDSPLTHTASIHHGMAAPGSTEDTSRWNSQTYIDHIITNQPHNTSTVSTLPWRISDHKCKACKITEKWQQETHRRVLKKSAHWTAPPHLQTSDWTDVLRQIWLDCRFPLQQRWDSTEDIDVNQEWSIFQQLLTTMCHKATNKVMQQTKRHPQAEDIHQWNKHNLTVSHNGQPASTKYITCKPKSNTSNMQHRKTINALARSTRLQQLLEYRSHKQHKEEINNLIRRLRLPPVYNNDYTELQRQLRIGIKDLTQQEQLLRKTQHRHAISRWRESMSTNPSARAKWINKSNTCAWPIVEQHNNQPLLTNKATVEAITEHWQQVWHEASQISDLDIHQQKQNITELLSHDHNHALQQRPTMKDLVHAWKQQAGAPGPDGWDHKELSFLPLEVLQDFHKLTERWENAATTPQALWESIQCNLPKPNKVKNQRIAVSQLRPICVYSIWWRLYSSMWTRAEGVRDWIANVLPKTSLTTLGTEHMCAQLLDSYAKCGYICSLDYTQAFDHVRPELALHCLQRLGCHPQLIGVLKNQWSKQFRWVTWQNYVAEEPMPVQCGIPQGDPMSPIALIALMEAGRQFILSHVNVPPHHHTIYMDDRSWTARSPTDLLNVLDQWRRFSTMTGLKESQGKTQISATTKSKMTVLKNYVETHHPDLTGAIYDNSVILGSVTQRGNRKMHDREIQRLRDGHKTLQRISLLPGSRAFRLEQCRIFAVSKASYGWLSKKINVKESKKFDTAVHRAAKGFVNSNPELRRVLEGASTNLMAVSGIQQVALYNKRMHVDPIYIALMKEVHLVL